MDESCAEHKPRPGKGKGKKGLHYVKISLHHVDWRVHFHRGKTINTTFHERSSWVSLLGSPFGVLNLLVGSLALAENARCLSQIILYRYDA